jgi:tetratricopeptide (TPR) repeat protein
MIASISSDPQGPSRQATVRWLRALAAWIVVTLSVTLHAPPPAHAGSREKAQAFARSAAILARDGRYEDAAKLFLDAYTLDPAPVLLFNLGQVLAKKGDYGAALRYLQQYLEVEQDQEKWQRAKQTLDKVRASRPGTLVLEANVAGALVVVNGREIGRSPLPDPVPVKTGRVEVRVTAEGKLDWSRVLDVEPGQTIELSAALEDLPGAREPVAAVPLESVLVRKPSAPAAAPLSTDLKIGPSGTGEVAEVAREGRPRTWTWVLIGSAAAALIAGGVTAALLLRDKGGGPPHADESWDVTWSAP